MLDKTVGGEYCRDCTGLVIKSWLSEKPYSEIW